VKSFLASEHGATATEFSIMFALLVGSCIAIIKTLAEVGGGHIWTCGPL
jgi:Flp pilus assembly pilin Flp